ncbi:hypothetical protein [Gimesia fumaroli]|uniref:Uncharacterized protein n=1 Tax=Gimesia fumaroli TaxID=2527976 RepID=A0A518I4R0_9PLAN|nr:hypothetical protein [Gimesia fumaroli]QDV48045.1 hypothetical protein Enr17x_00540 [Gimesia fumaroli]
MTVLTTRCFFAFGLFLLCALLPGCSKEEDPIEARLKEVGYTPEKIVRELELRITNLDKMPAREKRSKTGEKLDGDRNDGPRGNPFTFEAIIKDIKAKIDQLQERAGAEENILDQVKQKIESGTLDEKKRKQVLDALSS